jgi:hypothetical protein
MIRPTLVGPVKVDPAGRRVSDQLVNHIGGVGRIVGDEVDRTGRQTCVLERTSDSGVRPGARFGCLQHDRVRVRQISRSAAFSRMLWRSPGAAVPFVAYVLLRNTKPTACRQTAFIP